MVEFLGPPQRLLAADLAGLVFFQHRRRQLSQLNELPNQRLRRTSGPSQFAMGMTSKVQVAESATPDPVRSVRSDCHVAQLELLQIPAV